MTARKIYISAILPALFVFLTVCPGLCADENIPAFAGGSKDNTINAQELDASINRVMSQRQYTWKIPRQKLHENNEKGLIESFIEDVFSIFADGLRKVGEWLKKVLEWISERLKNIFNTGQPHRAMDSGWRQTVNILLYILLGVTASALAVFAFRIFKKRKFQSAEIKEPDSIYARDLNAEDVSATDLTSDKWLSIARDLMGRGNKRLALRAYYLASLSHLSRLEMITIASFKSNRDYEKELGRRSHYEPDLLMAFSQNISIFEAIWYGMHEITGSMVKDFLANQERIMGFESSSQ